MSNDSSGKDLQIIARHFYIKSLLHGVICVTMNQHECFGDLSLSFPGHLLVNDWNTITEKLATRS